MDLHEIPVSIHVDHTLQRIGYVTPWPTDPATFDGWIEESEKPTDELVVNGASEAWARYRVLAEYCTRRLSDINTTEGRGDATSASIVDRASTLLAAAAEEIEVTLFSHIHEDH
ncbi:hypothetical protein [Streptomyces cucumeris]|uniref:hypothetical protein n=1 Tax=Streptomyces cucumeris TaxID=2962890 RepID=UPI0020C83BD9|nr:hypothetical protein [Streptomyces sp. NEAU-Y11]MCP9209583.1 hypothetical protein [Streptomyces sp. NEAU-Y11]